MPFVYCLPYDRFLSLWLGTCRKYYGIHTSLNKLYILFFFPPYLQILCICFTPKYKYSKEFNVKQRFQVSIGKNVGQDFLQYVCSYAKTIYTHNPNLKLPSTYLCLCGRRKSVMAVSFKAYSILCLTVQHAKTLGSSD